MIPRSTPSVPGKAPPVPRSSLQFGTIGWSGSLGPDQGTSAAVATDQLTESSPEDGDERFETGRGTPPLLGIIIATAVLYYARDILHYAGRLLGGLPYSFSAPISSPYPLITFCGPASSSSGGSWIVE